MRRLQTKVGRLQTKGQGIGTLVHSLRSMNLSPMILHNGIKIKRPAHLSIVERLGGFWCCKGKTFIWIVQEFGEKNCARRVQKSKFTCFFAEPQPILCKNCARREKNQ